MPIHTFFPTLVRSAHLPVSALHAQLLRECRDLPEMDSAGREWSKQNYKNGFTSYASANEMQKFSPTFQKLEAWIDRQVAAYARDLDFDLGGGRLTMTTCWVNVMESNTHHSLHIHPLSVISGTYYVQVPPGAPAIKFEDPRLDSMMHAPPRREKCRPRSKTHVEVPAKPGTLVLFESWLRHEVPIHTARQPRISISFNYDWC